MFPPPPIDLSIEATSDALLALIAAGEGPKLPLVELDRRARALARSMRSEATQVVATTPMSGRAEIDDAVRRLIDSATARLWICSRFITEYYTDIIRLHRDRPGVDIRIITIPPKDAKNAYSGDGKRFIDPAHDALQRTLTSALRSVPTLHARCIISDDTALISSADLTKEQLQRELNLGVCTTQHEAVDRAASVFEGWWEAILAGDTGRAAAAAGR